MSRDTRESLKSIKPSPIRTFNDQIADIEGLIKLTLGEPDFPTPRFIKDAAIKSIDKSFNGYSHSKGMLELRVVISNYLKRKYDVDYRAEDQIIVTVGATEAIFSTLYSLLNPGDKVATPAPNYAVYKTQVNLAGGEFVPIDVTEDGFILTPERLDQVLTADPAIKVLMMNHPSNPTGHTYTAEQIQALAEIIKKHDIWVLSDEIYAELTYKGKHVSIAKYLPEHTILINGASKSHSMTGWRMGIIAGPADVLKQIFVIHQGAINAPTTQAQFAGLAAYSEEGDAAIEEMRLEYKIRRDYLLGRFRDMGFDVDTPNGAFYLFIKIPSWFEGDDMDFCLKVAHEAKVGLVPGQAFGEAGKNYFRLSYAASLEKLEKAVDRIEAFVEEYKPK
ncbi:aminotransferase class I/II-fold pyridoxal phosphate-dependent enzyme [Aerococcaceae bacterium WGS1372]